MPAISMSYGIIIYMYFMDNKQHKLPQAWIELHKDELQADWQLAVSGELPYKIEPLR